ncbi:MAG: hypothetical protein J6K01_03860 [Paludibacteraceae bacterium]|nr:hypothetical protein [Paludibacteraceae bacterium]
MKEAAEDAKKRGEEAMKCYFDKYQKDQKEALAAFKKKYSMPSLPLNSIWEMVQWQEKGHRQELLHAAQD